MGIVIGSVVALLVVAAELLIVANFALNSYFWWWKANNPVVDAGVQTTAIWCLASSIAVAYSLWLSARMHAKGARFWSVPLATAVSGVSGLMVFWGMVGAGLILLVQR